MNISGFLLGTALALTISQTVSASQQYYRYLDKDGNKIISSQLPAHVPKIGYEIVTSRGNVLKTVAPQKTAEELEAEKALLRAEKQKNLLAAEDAKQAESQAQKDVVLLKMFASDEDIKRSRNEKIKSIEILETITKDNLTRIVEQRDKALLMKNNLKKVNRPVPKNISDTINQSEEQISEYNSFLERKEQEKQQIVDKYDDISKRFSDAKKRQDAKIEAIKTRNQMILEKRN